MRFLSSYYPAACDRFFSLVVESAEIKKIVVLALSKGDVMGKIRQATGARHPAPGRCCMAADRKEKNNMKTKSNNKDGEVAA